MWSKGRFWKVQKRDMSPFKVSQLREKLPFFSGLNALWRNNTLLRIYHTFFMCFLMMQWMSHNKPNLKLHTRSSDGSWNVNPHLALFAVNIHFDYLCYLKSIFNSIGEHFSLSHWFHVKRHKLTATIAFTVWIHTGATKKLKSPHVQLLFCMSARDD